MSVGPDPKFALSSSHLIVLVLHHDVEVTSGFLCSFSLMSPVTYVNTILFSLILLFSVAHCSMSVQTSPDPELPFFRAWSLRPRARRTYSSEVEISPKATPTIPKSNNKARRPEHVRLTSGHFFDRIGLKDRSEKSRTTSEEENSVTKVITPTFALPGPMGVSPDLTPKPVMEVASSQLRAAGLKGITHSVPSTPGQKVGMYRRTLLRLGANSKQASAKRARLKLSPPRSFTGHVLDRASTILKHLPEKRLTPASSHSSKQSMTGNSAPCSHLSPLRWLDSNSSSLREILLGNAPLGTPTTPDPQSMYIGSDRKQYFRVEISAPGAPTYLPSEARRIGTPPLLEQDGKVRGFFFSYDVRDSEDRTLSSGTIDRSKFGGKRSSDIDWYTVKLKADEARDNAMHFELNVPEHLPSSPLCPKHPKHKSGGKGICVYHGRNRYEAGEL